MSKEKDEVVNKAIIFTRPFRPISFDPTTGNPIVTMEMLGPNKISDLIDLCLSIEKYMYGDKDESNES